MSADQVKTSVQPHVQTQQVSMAPVGLIQRIRTCENIRDRDEKRSLPEKKLISLSTPLSIQPKLAISRPDDPYEREADRVADQVMRMQERAIQTKSKCSPGKSPGCEDEEDTMQGEQIQRNATVNPTTIPEVPPIMYEAVHSPGEPLDTATRAFFEPRFGYDFGRVRVHTDSKAAKSAQMIHSKGFTFGHDLFFDTGQYTPQTGPGKRLLAHELMHVFQQNRDIDRVEKARGLYETEFRVNTIEKHIQRLTTEEKATNLQSPRYAGNPRIEAAYDNNPPMCLGEPQGEPVKMVQQGLIDDGFEMPNSTKKTGLPDGIFGQEMYKTVCNFQAKYDLDINGIVGRQTMGSLDALAGGGVTPKKEPEIEATDEAMGKRVTETMNLINDCSPTSGVWFTHNYRNEHDKDPVHYPMKESQYKEGYANLYFFDRLGWYDWRLKPSKSASKGIKAWINGLTIADCTSAWVAIEIDTLRAAVGDEKFDSNFGSEVAETPLNRRLRIRQGLEWTPVEYFMTLTEASKKALLTLKSTGTAGESGSLGNRPVKLGERYYFSNHPKYLLKHPGGAWEGENAVFMGLNDDGQQVWSGLGEQYKTEVLMLDDMVLAYNAARDSYDEKKLAYIRKINNGTLPSIYLLQTEGGTEFEDSLGDNKPDARQKILDAEKYTINNVTRKGGFKSTSGKKLSATEVQVLRNE